MNIIDLLFILILIGGMAIGLFQGIIRLLVSIAALYVSIVLASLYFQPLGNVLRTRFGSTLEAGQVTGFALILLVGFILLLLAGNYTFRYARLPTALDFLDRIIGTLLGLFLGALVLGLVGLVLRDLFVFQSPADTLNYPITFALQSGVRSSLLVNLFNNYVLPLIYRTVDPVLPPEANIIFKIK